MYVYNTYTRVMHFNEISIWFCCQLCVKQSCLNMKTKKFIYVNVDLFYTSQSLPM